MERVVGLDVGKRTLEVSLEAICGDYQINLNQGRTTT